MRGRQRYPTSNSSSSSQQRQQQSHLRRGQPLFRHTNPIYLWASVGILLIVWFLTPLSDFIVGIVVETVPIEMDVELGQQAWRDLRKKYKPIRDLWGIKRIGHLLLEKAGIDDEHYEAGMQWSFGVVHAPLIVNAFAFPGGIVKVTDSLLYKLDLTEGEIAALLGHEIGHVLHRHSQKRIIQQNLVSLVTKALIYEDNDDVDESFGQAIGELMLSSATYLGGLSFSRKDEYQADAAAWDLLVASGMYQPHSLQTMLAKLWSYEGSSGDTSWESTHPGTKDRIAALQLKWELLPKSEQKRLSQYPVQ